MKIFAILLKFMLLSSFALADVGLKSIECALAYRILHFSEVNNDSKTFKMCVDGDDEIFKLLNSQLGSKKFQGKNISIVKINGNSLVGCGFLYLGRKHSIGLKKVSTHIKKEKLLVFTSEGGHKKNSIIFFNQKNGKISFSVNKTLLDTNNISISAKVLRLASEVY